MNMLQSLFKWLVELFIRPEKTAFGSIPTDQAFMYPGISHLKDFEKELNK